MKNLICVFAIVLLAGCSLNGLISEIPNNEFSEFKYHRAANFTSATINAKNAVKEDGILMIEEVDITADYNILSSFSVYIKNLIIEGAE